MESLEAQISAVAVLDEPTRRRLYGYVVRHPEPVSRDDAAAALELPARPRRFISTGWWTRVCSTWSTNATPSRTGPGAGRPAKLYQRSNHHVALSLPQRRYDLAGRLLSSALDRAASLTERSPR